jgi:hypothetical protein
VGLVCANLFVLVERPAVRRLLDRHAEFLTLLEESFPRRTMEELLDALDRRRTRRVFGADGRTAEPQDQEDRLRASVEALTTSVRSLSERLPQAADGLTSAGRLTVRERRLG